MSEVKAISMESEAMEALRADMNAIINKTIKTMQMGKNGEATVSVKIKIGLEERTICHNDGTRQAIVPTFEHDVQSVVQTKDKKSGSMSGERELVYDPENDTWYMRDIRAQISIFDEAVQQSAEESGEVVIEAECSFRETAGYINAAPSLLTAGEDDDEEADAE